MQTRILFLILFAAILTSCNSGKKETAKPDEMQFAVNDSLLENSYLSLFDEYKMKVPGGWINSPELKSALSFKLKTENPYILDIQECFIDSVTKSVLLISDIEDLDVRTFSNMTEDVKTHYKYRHNGIIFDQFVNQDSVNISFKILIFDKALKKVQLDYIIPVQFYSELSRKIESSLGSINIKN